VKAGIQTLTSIFENGIQFETAELLLFTLQIDLKLGFTSGYPITLNGIRLLWVPAAATGPLADSRGMSKGISS